MVDFQILFNVAFSILGGLAGWTLKTMWSEIKEARAEARLMNINTNVRLDSLVAKDDKLSEKIALVALELPTYYVAKTDLEKQTQQFNSRFDRMEEKLDKVLTHVKH